MSGLRSIEEIHKELSELILEAVPEPDPMRRKALLTLADHWSDILRRRRAELGAKPVAEPSAAADA